MCRRDTGLQLLGHEIAQTLANHFADQLSASGHRGGSELELPKARALAARLTRDQALAMNLSLNATALLVGVHSRTFSRYRAIANGKIS